ncbi:hypothetical protein DUI87_08683 [Hirundo rustica rustica]|uniref:Uncharacterized protein n=1 Tax=Hirundo rustica rustica TaxID=333673 RepID=A0A3M0L2R5_HIRRU|nr:hypothetical protein DUI87_08683 [Hirundo rustica rustica]
MEARLSELELEKVQLVSTCTERLQALHDAKLEKDELLQELRAGQRELAGLAALEAAARMQKQITAKRGQADALQSTVKFLEEAMANTAKEKHYLREENSKLSQKLSCVRTENIRLAGDVEILRSQDKWLKEKLSKMETALDKASLQFAECQEQEAMRCRLQRTLDVRVSAFLRSVGPTSATSPMIRAQEVKTKKSKEKERQLFK